jgi:hypothetical protein
MRREVMIDPMPNANGFRTAFCGPPGGPWSGRRPPIEALVAANAREASALAKGLDDAQGPSP